MQENGQSLEELIEQSLNQAPSFGSTAAISSHLQGKEKHELKSRLIGKLPAISAALGNALLSASGNPPYTPPVIGAITYVLWDAALNLYRKDKRTRQRILRHDTSTDLYNRLLHFKDIFSLIAGGLAYNFPRFFDPSVSLAPTVIYAAVNSAGAYVLLSGLEKVMHSESLATLAHKTAIAFYRATKKSQEAVKHIERIAALPHSKEKEIAALLKLGDACVEAGQATEAMTAYKRMLKAAVRTDDFLGFSDWLTGQGGKGHYGSSHINNSGGVHVEVKAQQAMHEFVNRNFAAAHSLLAEAVAAEPHNRQLRRLRSLFFDAIGAKEPADLEMRIYEELLRRDPSLTYRLVEGSRNEVLVPRDETVAAPEVYIKRSKDKTSLDDEVANINAFSQELPSTLPRVIRQGFDGERHYIVLESMGEVTMLQKAMNGSLAYSDVKAAIDLLFKVIAAAEKLKKEGKIKVKEPITAPTYVYTMASEPSLAAELRNEGLSAEQPNFSTEYGSNYFAHRMSDLFALRVQYNNGVEFDQKFIEAMKNGSLVINATIRRDPTLNFTYTDFTHRNLIFDSLSGNLRGKIDMESLRTMPLLYELVNIFEFFKPNLSPVAYSDLMNYFIKKFESEMRMGIKRKAFELEYHAVAVQRHLELVGYRSRDTATNPENVRAQIYHYLMARMHLVELMKYTRKDPEEVKQALKEMLAALETTPILKDAEQQRQIELEIRQSVMPSIRYTWHELTQKSYWQEALRSFSPKEIISPLASKGKELVSLLSQEGRAKFWHDFRHPKPSPYNGTGLALPAALFVGVPSILAVTAVYMAISYAVLQAVMPSLPPLK